MKDVVGCDKPGEGAEQPFAPQDFRMRERGRGNARSLPPEHIGRVEGTEGTETSQYLEERKAKATSRVAASEMESA